MSITEAALAQTKHLVRRRLQSSPERAISTSIAFDVVNKVCSNIAFLL